MDFYKWMFDFRIMCFKGVPQFSALEAQNHGKPTENNETYRERGVFIVCSMVSVDFRLCKLSRHSKSRKA